MTNKFKYWKLHLWWLWLIFVFVVSIIPSQKAGMGGWVVQFQLDKIFHLLSHAIAIFLILIAFVPAKTKLSNNTKQIFYVFLSMLFFGIFIEYFQQNYITGRMFDVLDIVANILGDFSGLLLFFYSNKVLKQ